MIPIFIGYDGRETVAYNVLAHSIQARATQPVSIAPLMLSQLNGIFKRERHPLQSTDFSFSRFLTPYLSGFSGWSVFMDCDMLALDDVARLWELRDERYAVMCVKHDHRPKEEIKFLGAKQTKYEKKNWSSVMLWNCAHPDNRQLDPAFVESKDGAFLHRFKWLADEQIGEIPKEWNWLAIEYEFNPAAKLVHYTLGTPCFEDYEDTEMAELWHEGLHRTEEGLGK